MMSTRRLSSFLSLSRYILANIRRISATCERSQKVNGLDRSATNSVLINFFFLFSSTLDLSS